MYIDSAGEDVEGMDEEEKVDTLPATSSDNLIKKVIYVCTSPDCGVIFRPYKLFHIPYLLS